MQTIADTTPGSLRRRLKRTIIAIVVMLVGAGTGSFAQEQARELHFFWNPNCPECRSLREHLVLPLVEDYPQLTYHEYDLSDAVSKEILIGFLLHHNVPEERWIATTLAFLDGRYFINENEIRAGLPLALEEPPDDTPPPAEPEPVDARATLVDLFDRFGITAVALAGLVDGVNPCALAALIFLLSLLSVSGRSAGAVLATGLLYATGIFIAYFGAGFGIFRGLHALTGFDLAARLLYPGAALLTLALAIGTWRDYCRARRGCPEEMSLTLPKPLLKASHAVTRTLLRGRWFLLLAVVAGAAVSLLELFCTGQIYLPTLIYLSGRGEQLERVLPMLGLYVLMFTLPVIVLTVAVWAGASSRSIRDWAREHTATSKLAMTVIFALLTLALIAVSLKGWGM